MQFDVSKPNASPIFEAFGFGAICLIALAAFYRDNLVSNLNCAALNIDTLPNWIGLIGASVVVFALYIAGLGAIHIGETISRPKIVKKLKIKTESAFHKNIRVWELYLEMSRRVRFLHGIVGTSAWIFALLIFEMLRGWFNSDLHPTAVIFAIMSFLLLLAAYQKARLEELAFSVTILKGLQGNQKQDLEAE